LLRLGHSHWSFPALHRRKPQDVSANCAAIRGHASDMQGNVRRASRFMAQGDSMRLKRRDKRLRIRGGTTVQDTVSAARLGSQSFHCTVDNRMHSRCISCLQLHIRVLGPAAAPRASAGQMSARRLSARRARLGLFSLTRRCVRGHSQTLPAAQVLADGRSSCRQAHVRQCGRQQYGPRSDRAAWSLL
jgi:hypothetical protein